MPGDPSAVQTPHKRQPSNVMSITIVDPPVDELVGTQFTVQGDYYCPQTTDPTITCMRTGSNPPIEGQVTKRSDPNDPNSGTWQAYFNNPTTGPSTVTATISHPGQSTTKEVVVNVSSNPGVTVNQPGEGQAIPDGDYEVTGTCSHEYNNTSYVLQCSLRKNGRTKVAETDATVNAQNQWTATLDIPDSLDDRQDMSLHVVIHSNVTGKDVAEIAIAQLSITSLTPPPSPPPPHGK